MIQDTWKQSDTAGYPGDPAAWVVACCSIGSGMRGYSITDGAIVTLFLRNVHSKKGGAAIPHKEVIHITDFNSQELLFLG